MMTLLLGNCANFIHERQGRLKIWKLVGADDVMFVDDAPLRGISQQTMKVGKVFSP